MQNKHPLTSDIIRHYVGANSFQKGKHYVADGAIQQARVKNDVLTAVCQGHEFDPYKVEVIFSKKGIKQSYCTCPVGGEGRCKHVAALLIAWLEHPDIFTEWTEIRNYLKGYDTTTLLELIDLLEEKIPSSSEIIHAFQYNLQTLEAPDLAKYLKRIEESFHVSRFPWYHPDQAAANEIIFGLRKIETDALDLIQHKQFAKAIRIYQSIIHQILIYLDDHRDIGGVFKEEIKACLQGLQRILVNLPDTSEWRARILRLLFHPIEEQMYRETSVGAEEARRIILENSTPAEKEQVASWVQALQSARWQTRHAEENNWLQDFLIDLKKDQLNPDVYLTHYRETGQTVKLVDSLLTLNQVHEAEQIARQSQSNEHLIELADLFFKHQQPAFAEQLVLESIQEQSSIERYNWLKNFYINQNQLQEALKYVLKAFYLAPQLATYEEVSKIAQSLKNWPTVRQELVESLKEREAYSLLIEIDLKEKKFKEAIETFNLFIYQKPQILDDINYFTLALRLAEAVQARFSSFTIQIYQLAVDKLIAAKNRESYRTACDYLKQLKNMYETLQQQEEWHTYLDHLLQTHKRLRVLKEMMHQEKLI